MNEGSGRGYIVGFKHTPLTSKKGGKLNSGFVGGDACSLLSSIWPKCLTSNFASSPQEHTKLHRFQMFSAQGQNTDTCEVLPPSHTEDKWEGEAGLREGVRVFI